MRTLQEKYNAINEGKFSKDQFLRDARMEQPNLVTKFNGYDDAVQILKNRGMIQEALADYSKVLELPNGNYFAIDADWEDEYQGNNGLFFTVKGNTIYDKSGQAIQSSPREFISQFTPEEILKVENVNEARLTKNNLTDYRYKATNDMDKYPYEQILRGLRVELEGLNVLGTPTPEEYTKALGKVLKNLEKDSIFYTNQVAGVKANKKRTDVMVDATPKNEVDKENGLQKAALKEAIKGVIKNILSEGVNLSPEGPQMFEDEDVYEMYADDSEIDYDDENFSDPFIDGDLDENKYAEADAEADRKFILKLMDMYEANPSKYETLHREAQLMARTEKDIKYKHLLSLIDRAKAGALQRLANQDRYQAGIEGMDEIATDITGFPKWRELGQDEKDHISKFVKDTGDRDQAEYEKRKAERLKAQSARLGAYISGKKDLEEDIFESVSLFDILDEGSSKHSTEWFKGYRAFNDDKKLSSNPYKENPEKKDWAAGWDKAQSDEKKNN